jgi:cytochrome c-type biogenesis protein CcmH
MLLFAAVQPASAVNPDEILDDPKLEQRARDLSSQIRCMKCQNQSIDDSDASLARDLRVMVRERIVAGDTDQQVLDFLVDRFGEFVLLKPSFSFSNLFLWAAPILALLAGIFFSVRMMLARKTGKPEDADTGSGLSQDENVRLTKILDERD